MHIYDLMRVLRKEFIFNTKNILSTYVIFGNILWERLLTTELALLLRDLCGWYFVIDYFAAFCAARLVKCTRMSI